MEFYKLKITPIVVFVFMIQRIFPCWALAPTHCTIGGFFYFRSLMKSAFLVTKGLSIVFGISLLAFTSTSHSFTALIRELSSWSLEEKFHIYARHVLFSTLILQFENVLYIYLLFLILKVMNDTCVIHIERKIPFLLSFESHCAC